MIWRARGHEINVRSLALAFVCTVACGARTELTALLPPDAGGEAQTRSLYSRIACGEAHTCVLRSDGAVLCWGLDTSGQTSAPLSTSTPPTVVPLSGPASAIGLGELHSCAVVSSHVFCWGDDLVGQLASNVPKSATPLYVGVPDAVDVVGGNNHSCALLTSGAVVCWGQNSEGELGNGSSFSSTTPLGVPVANVTALSRSGGGTEHTCVVVGGGAVLCWGANLHGEIGSGDVESLAPTPELAIASGAVSVAVVDFSSCAVMSDATLRCWGDNDDGQLGDGALTSSPVPIVANVDGVSRVSIASAHACALLTNGRVSCWGANTDGRLGDGTMTSSVTPVVALTSGAIDLCAGGGHTCALMSDGRVLCWGLGTTIPTPVNGL